jgi:hypothetical protein
MIWARDVDVIAAWQGDLQGAKENPAATKVTAALTAAQEALEGKYHDSHCWVFTPHSFARLLGDLARLGFVRMACRQLSTGLPQRL